MKMKKALGMVLSMAMISGMAVPAAVQAADTTEEITLKICTHYYDNNKLLADYAAEKVKEKYPNVTLEFEDYPQDGGQTLKTRAATGDLPDLFNVDGGLCETLIKSGSILALDDYYEETGYAEANLSQGIIDSCLQSSDGHIYQFPLAGVSPILWYYNKQIFEENNIKVPENYEELMTAIEELQAIDIIPLAMFGKEPWPIGAFFDMFALKENASGLKGLSEGTGKASDEDYSKAIHKLADAIDAGLFQSGVTNTDYDTASAMFLEGRAAMFVNGSWYLADIIDGLGENAGFLETYPTADAGESEETKYRMAGGPDTNGLAVSANTKYPELAMDVAAIYCSAREQEEYTNYQNLTAPVKTEELTINADLEPIQQQLLDAMPSYTYGSQFVHVLPNTKFSTDMTEEIQKLFVGESAEDFIKNVDKSIEKSTK